MKMLMITKGVRLHLNIFSKKLRLAYVLNNIHFVVLHVWLCTMSSFASSSRGHLVKFDVILMLLIDSFL